MKWPSDLVPGPEVTAVFLFGQDVECGAAGGWHMPMSPRWVGMIFFRKIGAVIAYIGEAGQKLGVQGSNG
jgi:hypothetical protein